MAIGNPQVSFGDVKIAAAQLGFKGKDGLVMEPRTTILGEGGSDEPDEDLDEQGEREALGEKEGLVGESTTRAGQGQCEDFGGNGEPNNAVDDVMIGEEVEIPGGENGAAGGGKNGNVDVLPQEVGEAVEHEGVGQLDRGDIQGVGGNVQEVVEEVPSSQVEFQGALEEDETASRSVRATSTPVAGGNSENNAGKTSRVEIEQIDENGNEEGEAISEARATFSMGALMAREGIQEGFVEASSVGEQDMLLDLSLMEKTRDSQINLGSGGQGPRSRSRSASRVMNLLKGSAKKRHVQQGLHKGMLKKAINGNGISKTNVLQKEKTQLRFMKVMQDIKDTQQYEGLHKRSMLMQGDSLSNQTATNIGRECRKCGKAVRRAKGYLCVECEGVFHVRCSARKFVGEGWVCQRCKKQASEKPVQKQGGAGAGDWAAKAGKVTRRSHSVSTKIASGAQECLVGQVAIDEGEKPSACNACTGCARKKGCKKLARWNQVQKQAGGVAAKKARKVLRRSQSVSTNIGRVAPLKGPVKQVASDEKVAKVVNRRQESGKRKMGESEAPERAVQGLEEKGTKRACIDKRVGFNKAGKRRSSTLVGSERPVRSSARKEVGSYWEKPAIEERLRCKYCKASFSAASRLHRWLY